MKKFLSVLLCATLCVVLLFSGCGQQGTTGTTGGNTGTTTSTPKPSESSAPSGGNTNLPLGERPADGWTFGYTCMDGTNPFFVILEKTIREGVESRGDKLITTDPANDVTRQITQIEDMITQGIDAIFLNPAEAEGILPALDMLKEAGIPILNFDTEVADLSYCFSYVGSDNYNAGFVCGQDLVKKVPNGGKLIILNSPTMNSINDRERGFRDAIEGKGFDIVAVQDAKGNLEVAMGIAEDLLQAHSDVVAIFGGNDPTALGALAAANAAGLKDVLIYGVDGSPDIKKELASGNSLIEGTGAQSPINIAKISVEVMYKYLAGEKVDARYPVETFLITSENVNQYGIDSWQ
ncbi:MAG TPA: sugar ABC transporter substrate-binding protein [Clostridiaceae bacterium]|nr:sugar ABC transporter substrate-binding protein [Clostridiaceae bacterium]